MGDYFSSPYKPRNFSFQFDGKINLEKCLSYIHFTPNANDIYI
jgi:hypothetical protein